MAEWVVVSSEEIEAVVRGTCLDTVVSIGCFVSPSQGGDDGRELLK